MQIGNRRQRHHGVAEPVRRENKEASAHACLGRARCATFSDWMSAIHAAPIDSDPHPAVLMDVYNERTTVEKVASGITGFRSATQFVGER